MQINVNGQVFTQSEITLWDECPYKWYLRYQQRLDALHHISWALVVGSEWHECMEALYREKGKNANDISCNVAKHLHKSVVITTEIEKEIQYWNEVLEATVQAYAKFYVDDFKVFVPTDFEKTLQVDVEIEGVNFSLAGKRDMKGKFRGKGVGIWDHKTFGQISKSLTEGWGFKFQFMFYLWLDYKCDPKNRATEFLVNGVKKTALRWKEGENIITFAARVHQDIMTRPETYFYRQSLDLTAEGIKAFEEKILMPKLKRIAMLQNHPESAEVIALSKNTEACNHWGGQCEYFANCYFGETKQYKIRTIKHTEL